MYYCECGGCGLTDINTEEYETLAEVPRYDEDLAFIILKSHLEQGDVVLEETETLCLIKEK